MCLPSFRVEKAFIKEESRREERDELREEIGISADRITPVVGSEDKFLVETEREPESNNYR